MGTTEQFFSTNVEYRYDYRSAEKIKNTSLLQNFNMLKFCTEKSKCWKADAIGIWLQKEYKMSKKIRTEAVDHLFEAILCLKDKEECYTFFEDVCTINEILSLSQRFEVAHMLREQKTYLDIAEKTGASTATISRVNRSLNYGNDGYDMVFKRMEEKKEQNRSLDQKDE